MRRHSGDRICSDNASQTAIPGLFMDLSSSSASAIETGRGYMTDLAFCYIIMGINSSFNGMLRGLGV